MLFKEKAVNEMYNPSNYVEDNNEQRSRRLNNISKHRRTILLGCQQSFGVFFKNFIFVFSLQKYN